MQRYSPPLSASDISSMRYNASHCDIRLRRVRGGEYHIAKAIGFYIAFAARQIYHTEQSEVYRLFAFAKQKRENLQRIFLPCKFVFYSR